MYPLIHKGVYKNEWRSNKFKFPTYVRCGNRRHRPLLHQKKNKMLNNKKFHKMWNLPGFKINMNINGYNNFTIFTMPEWS